MLLEFGPCLSLCVLHCIASFHESHAWHIFIRVDAETEVAYELIAEPVQEPPAGDQQLSQHQKKSLTLLTCKASPGAYPLF